MQSACTIDSLYRIGETLAIQNSLSNGSVISPPALQHHSLEDALRVFREESAPAGKKSGEQTWESGRRYMTHAGFRVRSKAEKIIADYVSQGGMKSDDYISPAAGKWRATQVREALVPAARKVIELAGLTPSLIAYDRLLEREVTHVS